MSADSIHAQVGKRIKRKKQVNDFANFHECVDLPNSEVVLMTSDLFLNLPGLQSQAKLSCQSVCLTDICVLQFRRGSRFLFYKARHTDTDFQSLDFMKDKTSIPQHMPTLRDEDRVIPAAKKADIIHKLVPLMPSTRTEFWRTIKVSETADLIDEDD